MGKYPNYVQEEEESNAGTEKQRHPRTVRSLQEEVVLHLSSTGLDVLMIQLFIFLMLQLFIFLMLQPVIFLMTQLVLFLMLQLVLFLMIQLVLILILQLPIFLILFCYIHNSTAC